jgi:homoserine O-acetyltransferase/O-succinyltransferase
MTAESPPSPPAPPSGFAPAGPWRPELSARFTVQDFHLETGAVLPWASLAWQWRGPVGGEPILACTAFAATPLDLAYLAEPGLPLDAQQRPVLQVELLGNGRSSSPSNTPPPWDGPRFPALSMRDNVRLQAALLDHLGVARVHAVVGASLGGAQALQWVVSHPERVGRAVVIAGNAATTFYGRLFLHTVRSALLSDPAFAGGDYRSPPLLGLTRLSETWAAFGLSPRFFTTGAFRQHADMVADDQAGDELAGFLAKWGTRYHQRDANDLLCHLSMWDRHDVGRTPGAGGDLSAAAARAAAVPILFAPISTDAYFHPDDVREQAAPFARAEVQTVGSLSGHAAAFGRTAADRATLAALVGDFLRRPG